MKEVAKWKNIAVRGLSRYEISDTAKVRIKSSRRVLPYSLTEKREKVVSLIFYGKQRTFSLSDLMFKTFKKPLLIEYDDVPNIEFLVKPEQFSEDEEDYGRNENKVHWEEIRELGKKATYNKNQSKEDNS